MSGSSRFHPTEAGIERVHYSGSGPLIGVLLVLVTDVFTRQRLPRPLLGTGVLGGFTTFSTYAVDIQRLVATGHATLGVADLAGTVVAALAAVTVATRLTRCALRVVQR